MGKILTALALVACVAAAGCTRSTTNALSINTQSPPQPLPSQPAGSVQSGQLDPISQDRLANGEQVTTGADGTTVQPTDGTQVASLEPQTQANAQPLNHEQLAGAWNVSSDSAGCRVFLSFTQWSGGYRAGSRGCTSPELASISAWDVKGSRVTLVDSNGTEVASLGKAGTEQYSGNTSGGLPITFSR